ncbi:MAG: ATP-binding protein [Chloroflexi bacterium AL-W]|nr:ATP-binding protein [Chloroflexi bacterium AL-N1]NOK69219.1 ATP-binding protein [Chloroflexi bacterium AL-N10]NOK77202.1 ATP-binding protein [Chloroflexi bacterium AL-N5]NOK83847.1 ATP-binding protein [Chloroflexi bacterium AL-W]NOK91057.1 ATP-binding protein [Chloroflexi bacterium AL-N15]
MNTDTTQPIVHLMCGLPTSGKTTFARRIATERQAICFTLDEWMLNLYDYTIYDPEYGQYAVRCQEQIWSVALQLLACGVEVILDWSLWSAQRRKQWKDRIDAAGYPHRLYCFPHSLAVLQERLRQRNHEQPSGTHVISEAELLRFAPLFEPPMPHEGLTIVEITT